MSLDPGDLDAEALARRAGDILARRRRGQTFGDIGAAHKISKQRAHQIYWDTLAEIKTAEVVPLRAEAAERLDDLRRELYAVLEAKHPLVQQGRVVRVGEAAIDEEGKPYIEEVGGEELLDAGPKLLAIRTLLRLEERHAKLHGLDVPVRVDLGSLGAVRVEIVGVDPDVLT